MLVRFSGASLSPLFTDLNLELSKGETLAVLGPNGVGKTSFLNTILGNRALTAGSVEVSGRIGYIPQQRMFDPHLPLRARDLVSLSIAHGIFRNRRATQAQVDDVLARVGASHIANARAGELSGGQQQLIRQAQALANNPQILLADEPLLSLDTSRQRSFTQLLTTLEDTTKIIVTHSISPLYDIIDRILYFGPLGHSIGTKDEVLTSENLSALNGTRVEVARINDRMVII